MPIGLTNSPISCMKLMNHVLREYRGKFVVVYFVDIIVYSKSLKEHVEHVKRVIATLRAESIC